MPRPTAAALLLDDEPVLKFEESRAHLKNTAFVPAAEADDGNPYDSLKRKQEELLKLRHELDRAEREKQELEAQRQKEQRFVNGRRDLTEKFSRALVRLERELYNSQKAIEEITIARDLYQRHSEVIKSLHPETWQQGNIDGELDRAIAAIEDAEDVFGKTSRRLATVLPAEAAALEASGYGFPRDFKTWVRLGFAFTLPLTVGLILFVVINHYLH